MPGSDNQQNDNKIIEAAVNIGLAVEKANEATNPAILDMIAKGEAAAPATSGCKEETASGLGDTIVKGMDNMWEGTKSVGQTVKNAAVGIGENWWDSYTKRSALAELINGDPKQPTEQYIEAANKITEQLSIAKQGIASIPRTAFHLTTVLPICTDKAVLRCSFGIGVGPLTVASMNRTQIGTPPNYIATVMDFTPANMPQFIMCFNILNPAVAAATAAATAAAGGVFTLVPMTCRGTRAPTPWIPTTKNTCGKMPLLTQTSCSTCWGIGSISILHCGQGLTNTYRFLVPGADGSADMWTTTKVWIESLLNLAGGVTGGLKALSGLTTRIGNAFKAVKMERLAEGTKKLSEGVYKFSQSQKLGKGLEVIDYAGNTAHAGMSIAEGDTAGAVSDIINIGTSGAFKVRSEYKAGKAAQIGKPSTKDLQQANTRVGETNTELRKAIRAEGDASADLGKARGRVNEAESMRTNTQSELSEADTNLNKANERLNNADSKLTGAQQKFDTADAELKSAKAQQAKATDDLERAQAKQAEATKNTETARGKRDEAGDKLNDAKNKQADADKQLSDAQKRKEEVYSNPKSTPAQKMAADNDLQTAKSNKAKADTDVDTATQAKSKADDDYNTALEKEGEARSERLERERDKITADSNVRTKQAEMDSADANLSAHKTEYENAKSDVELKEREYSSAFDKNQKAENEWRDAQENYHKKEDIHDHAQQKSDEAIAQKREARQQFDEAGSDYQAQQKAYDDALANTTGDKIASNVAGWGKDPAKSVLTEVINDDGKDETEVAEKFKDEFDKYNVD